MTGFRVGDILTAKGGTQERVTDLVTVNGEAAIRLVPVEGGPPRVALVVYTSHFIATGILRLEKRKKERLRLSA